MRFCFFFFLHKLTIFLCLSALISKLLSKFLLSQKKRTFIFNNFAFLSEALTSELGNPKNVNINFLI